MDLNALMRRIQQGDREAFATLYARYNKTVFRIALDSTHDNEEAKQVVVAVFREMYQTIRAKGPYLGDLYGWLDALTAKQVRLRRMMRVGAASETAARPAAPDRPRRYTEEEAAALEERAQRRLNRIPEKAEETRRGSAWLSIAGLSVTALLLLWVLVGLLGTLSILPRWDLGYAWFNDTLFTLF
ncbi:MAG TPA: hypothetical protein VN366_02995 [Feifaniaceae bacterium]|nr:hypothetical protein [Feifaniaceae bacterium]